MQKPELIVQKLGDDTSLPDGKKKAKIENNRAVHNWISSHLFKYLESHGIPTHFVQQLSNCEMLVKRLQIIPFGVIARNIASGNLSASHGMKESLDLPHPILEHSLKSEDLRQQLINKHHMFAMGFGSPEKLKFVNRMACNGMCEELRNRVFVAVT
jgi:phosphoribosylaminoimidazole-succinocarboxamide synthase